jgi:hypothetical protein
MEILTFDNGKYRELNRGYNEWLLVRSYRDNSNPVQESMRRAPSEPKENRPAPNQDEIRSVISYRSFDVADEREDDEATPINGGWFDNIFFKKGEEEDGCCYLT